MNGGSSEFSVTPVTSRFEMAECLGKPQGDQTVANEKLGHSYVLVSEYTEFFGSLGLYYPALRCRDVFCTNKIDKYFSKQYIQHEQIHKKLTPPPPKKK